MKTITNILTSSDINEGIKNITVFLDTIVLNFKSLFEYVLIDKISFTTDIETENKGYVLTFGNTGSTIANLTTGNCYIDTIFLEKEKLLYVCGLSCYNIEPSLTIFTEPQSGYSYVPIIYKYDINEHTVTKLITNEDEWINYPFGDLIYYPSVSYDGSNIKYCMVCQKSVNENDLKFINIIGLGIINDIISLESHLSLSSTNIDIPTIDKFVSNAEKDILIFKNGIASIPYVLNP